MTKKFTLLLAIVATALVVDSALVLAQSESAPPGGDDDQAAAAEEGFFSRFIDPYDGRLDFTAGGEEGGASGLVPLVIPGNDPTLGPNLLMAAVYFHPPDPSVEPVAGSPPTMTFGGAGVTENESWAVAGGHSTVWNEGRTRYFGLLGTASINLEYFGTDSSKRFESDPLDFNIEGDVLVQQAQFRLGSSNFFAGGRYTLMSTDVTFEITPEDDIALGTSVDAGATAFISFDSRDNTFTPNRGTKASIGLSYFSESLGGEFNYSKADLAGVQYWQLLDERLSLGLRTEYHFADDDAPFYSLPWVSLRGLPIFRYVGNHAITVEIEPRWQIDERWSVLGFAGVGRASAHFDGLGDAERAYNYGVGFRYLLARRLGLAAGFDLARGPEETTVYLTFGNAWGF